MENLDDDFLGSNIGELTDRFEKMIESGDSYYYEVDDLEELLEYYLGSQRIDMAQKVIDTAHEQYPYNRQLCIKEAELLSLTNRPDEALALLSEVEDLEGFNPDFHITKASILSQCGKYENAIRALYDALECHGHDADLIYLNLAIEHQNLEAYPKAIGFLEKALEINPDNEDALYELSYCYEMSQNSQGAVRSFSKVIDHNPYNAHAWFNLGYAYDALGESEKAVNAFDYAIIIDEDFHAAYFSKGNVLVRAERYREALDVYRKTLDFEIIDSLVYFYIGDCYDNLGDFRNALINFEKAIKRDGALSEAWLGASNALDNLGRELEALQYARKAISLDPSNGDYWSFLGSLQFKYDLPEDATISFEKAIEHGYIEEELWIEYAQLSLQTNNMELAASVLERAMSTCPQNHLLIVYNAVRLYRIGDTDQGFETLIDVLMHAPELVEEFFAYFPAGSTRHEIQTLIQLMKQV